MQTYHICLIPFLLTNMLVPESYSLHINCAGKQVTVNGNETYDDDTDNAGPARFHLSEKTGDLAALVTSWIMTVQNIIFG